VNEDFLRARLSQSLTFFIHLSLPMTKARAAASADRLYVSMLVPWFPDKLPPRHAKVIRLACLRSMQARFQISYSQTVSYCSRLSTSGIPRRVSSKHIPHNARCHLILLIRVISSSNYFITISSYKVRRI